MLGRAETLDPAYVLMTIENDFGGFRQLAHLLLKLATVSAVWP